GKLIRIAHEKLLVFKQDNGSSIVLLGKIKQRAEASKRITWRAAVRRILQGKTLPLAEIYAAIEPYARRQENNHWQAKVRQVLQNEQYFNRVETGVYQLAA